MSRDLHQLLERRIDGSLAAVASLRDRARLEQIATIAEVLRETLAAGGTVFACGNGGSAAEALHFSEELIGRYRRDRTPFRAVCLNADPTALTCIGNDFGFEHIFARPCSALVTPADALVVFSTSGHSDNVVLALKEARARGGRTVGLLGRDGGRCAALCDHALVVPSDDSAHIQEAHQVILHLLCEALEGSGAGST